MEAVIFCGIQATGKSTFYRQRFVDTHLRLNMDMLRTRHREAILLRAFLEAKQPFVVDNTNPTVADRARYILPAKAARFRVVGYHFQSTIDDAMARNSRRDERSRVRDLGVRGCYRKLEIPRIREGFDALYYVRLVEGGDFAVEEWRDEIR